MSPATRLPGTTAAVGPGRPVPTFKLASVLLQYPTAALLRGIDHLDAVAAEQPRPGRHCFAAFLAWLRHVPPAEAAQHYVATFDLRSRCPLYLTYYRYGDTRRRGIALVAFTAAYRAAGFEPVGTELPDYLPMVLDFAAVHRDGVRLLRAHRASVALLHRGLCDVGSPYAHVVEAVRAQLPALGRHDHALVERWRSAGPPAEQVGLEPFAPPGYLTGGPGYLTGEPREGADGSDAANPRPARGVGLVPHRGSLDA